MSRLFYIDESRDKFHHFHAGVLGTGTAIASTEVALEQIVDDAVEDGVCRGTPEIHAVDIYHGNGKWKYGSIAERCDVFDKILTVLQTEELEVIARGVLLPRFNRKYPGTDPFRWEFSNLLERLNERLRSLDDVGLVIADQQYEYREVLQRDVADGKTYGTGGYRNQKLVRILDTAHFVDSRLSRLVQVADVVAFMLRRRATIPTERDTRLEARTAHWESLIWSRVPDPKGQYVTIR